MQQTAIEQSKNVGDVIAATTAGAAWLKLAPEAAAVAALIYTVLRIGELLFKWARAWIKRHRDAANGPT